MKSVYDVFRERGFIEQITDESQIRELLEQKSVTCYIGFDPTATSLHIGSLVPIMSLAHLQRHGHRPIALVGGGTGLIGDPSGKTEMRQILTREQIDHNAGCLKKQLSRYIDFREGGALLLNNADWLTQLNYIEFLRDIGRHFSVNRMLAAESYRVRLEKGLNFIEFNYMLLQAYDFLHLFRHYHCLMQMGGNDQWGNMVAGIDLIRRVEEKTTYSLTFPLITTSQGNKMGKTEKGTIWLDAELTSPYEYYQYWINTEDGDVARFLALFTFLPMEEIVEVKSLSDARLNMAKTVLAFEATKITHGEAAAVAAWKASAQAFGVRPTGEGFFPSSTIPRSAEELDTDAIPSLEKSREALIPGIPAFELFHEAGLCSSRGEARRLITQGGGYVNDRQIGAFDEKIGLPDADEKGEIRLRKGKKRYVILSLK
ncbi:MAG: tyrosine--tRNA ligase [Syntrophobacterales bacterium CG_4_8_14_3_um_filter_58_8]|nr:MAG: tyrosine--tRNA ligase [Syntrophaceae bacterium CG2_30_58_14]PIV07079.1 MAG: tyrosine--tRNA ligase [Syntrophobacterales bacterium CG03_land_8_20_14_0_80_58_14]PJC74375.1 MAG: tyrosine--tRNA ligase [Syntrophobacterales bacterium CG_4_8_14_3_um_filter_58_8]